MVDLLNHNSINYAAEKLEKNYLKFVAERNLDLFVMILQKGSFLRAGSKTAEMGRGLGASFAVSF